MRNLPIDVWTAALSRGGVEIISSTSSADWDSYVLSESSLFVSRSRLVCKTCGQSAPLFVLEDILAACATVSCSVRAVIFSRSNLLDHSEQQPIHRSFAAERHFLDNLLQTTGQFYIFGDVSGTHWNLYTATFPFNGGSAASGPSLKDEGGQVMAPSEEAYPATLEMAMYGLEQNTASAKWWKHAVDGDAVRCRTASGLGGLMSDPAIIWDDYVFDPCGYSMNALDRNGQYFTVHVTPQDGCSFASFETTATGDGCSELLRRVLDIFQPTAVSISLLDAEGTARPGSSRLPSLEESSNFLLGSDCTQQLANGFGAGSHHYRSYTYVPEPTVIPTPVTNRRWFVDNLTVSGASGMTRSKI
eukprot:SAG31_NODE_3698_length_3976_cov_13.909466_1_plen_359_part_00